MVRTLSKLFLIAGLHTVGDFVQIPLLQPHAGHPDVLHELAMQPDTA